MCSIFVLQLLSFAVIALSAQADKQPDGRIIGGTTVDIARHPYIVSLRYRRPERAELGYLHECASVIYNDTVLLTAAQCLWNLPEGTKIMAVAGARTRNGTDGLIYPVSEWKYHEKFEYRSADYDIGVLKLQSPLKLSQYGIRAIGIRASRPSAGRMATVAGWGYREEWGPSSYQLEQVQVPIITQEQCGNVYGPSDITDRMVCAGDLQHGGSDSCQGDTGGPLVIDEQLLGLVSWGRGCGRPGYPTVYTFVGSLKEWISKTIDSL